jgi:mono/diheme cytochrome c family protein
MRRFLGFTCLFLSAGLAMAAADGAWLHRVSPADHNKVSPFGTDPSHLQDAASAGSQIFQNNCAKCHGADAMGKGSRPALISTRIAGTTDGDLFWILSNGNPWKGMPPWTILPAKQRWQVVAYLRSLNASDSSTPSQEKPQ